MDRGAWRATVHGITKIVTHDLATQFSSVAQLCLTLWPHGLACQASPSITNSWSLFKLMSIESVMPSNHVILCCPLPLLSSMFPSLTGGYWAIPDPKHWKEWKWGLAPLILSIWVFFFLSIKLRTGTTQRDGMGREEGGGFRMGNTCIPVADSFWYLAKLIQLCKV